LVSGGIFRVSPQVKFLYETLPGGFFCDVVYIILKEMNNNEKITYFAQTDARGKKTPFGIKAKDRTRHVYVIGKTGMGKSTLLENMAVQDIQNGEGMAFIDPHGKTADLLLDYIPEERMKDVVYFAPFDIDNPIAFNIMEDVGVDKRHLVAAGLMSAFKKIWVDAWSARMEYILGNVILALLEYPGATMLSINRMLTDKDYRKAVVANVKDPSTRSFWVDEYSKYTDRYTADATPAIQNKVGQFTSNPLIRNMVGQTKSSFDIRKIMDEKKILIVNLSKGQIGEGNANLLGSMIITKIYLAAMSRADVSETEMKALPNFYTYVDEFQSFANESFADILSEARKYKLNLTIAHQYIEQMSDEVRSAVFGNVGTMITFRVGALDADLLEKEFAPVFTAEDLVNLGMYQIYLKLMIDDMGSHPFSATTLPPIALPDTSSKKKVIENSRKLFAHPRTEVEDFIKEWYKPVVLPKKEKKEEPVKSRQPAKDGPSRVDEGRSFTKPREFPRDRSFTSTRDTVSSRLTPRTVKKEELKPASAPTNTNVSSRSERPPVSLSALKTNTPKRTLGQRKDDKGPTPEKMQSLKEALSAAMKEKDTPASSELRKPKFATPPKKETPIPKPEVPQPSGEVPEETLKKILE